MTVGPPSLLTQHIQRESQRWEARHRTEPPCTPSISISSSDSDATIADRDSLFSSSPRSRSRRSSISSVDDDHDDQLPRPPLLFQPQQAPIRIPVYGSLAEAAAQSTLRILGDGAGGGGAGEVRRLVTPGKLYENEEEDDAIVYDDGDDEVAAG